MPSPRHWWPRNNTFRKRSDPGFAEPDCGCQGSHPVSDLAVNQHPGKRRRKKNTFPSQRSKYNRQFKCSCLVARTEQEATPCKWRQRGEKFNANQIWISRLKALPCIQSIHVYSIFYKYIAYEFWPREKEREREREESFLKWTSANNQVLDKSSWKCQNFGNCQNCIF